MILYLIIMEPSPGDVRGKKKEPKTKTEKFCRSGTEGEDVFDVPPLGRRVSSYRPGSHTSSASGRRPLNSSRD